MKRRRRCNPEDFPTGTFVDVEKIKVNADAAGNVTSIDIIVDDKELPSSLIHPLTENRRRRTAKRKK